MPVITMDETVQGMRRNDVLTWLGEPSNHTALLEAGFDEVTVTGPGEWRISLRMGMRAIAIDLRFLEVDDRHGGRRVRFSMEGRRTRGKLTWSLRTSKPSTNTLVTLHVDYRSGRVLGPLLDATQTRGALEAALHRTLVEVTRRLPE
jgi:hypothetical protein